MEELKRKVAANILTYLITLVIGGIIYIGITLKSITGTHSTILNQQAKLLEKLDSKVDKNTNSIIKVEAEMRMIMDFDKK